MGRKFIPNPKRDETYWRNECQYISDVTDKRGNVHEMNHDKPTFIHYCEMQKNIAEKDGFHDAAQYIERCLDDLRD